LVNPASDNGRTGRGWPELAHAAASAGLVGDTYISERRGQLGELGRRAVTAGATLLVIVGGDGTVNEVVNGVAGIGGIELAIVPRGTGYDFARTFGLPQGLAAFKVASTPGASPTAPGRGTSARGTSSTSRAPA
jgi:diacylglycerol kinase (ATP)